MNRWILSLLIACLGCSRQTDSLEHSLSFAGNYGQVEIGGRYAGLEFHNSRPLPSRISFYYPVANSVDLSTDYWKRWNSMPFSLTITRNEREEALGVLPSPYTYTPYRVSFVEEIPDFTITYQYDVCDTLPVFIRTVRITNTSSADQELDLTIGLKPILRSCHTYDWHHPAEVFLADGSVQARFESVSTDSVTLFMQNLGQDFTMRALEEGHRRGIGFEASAGYKPGEEKILVQAVGIGRTAEMDSLLQEVAQTWEGQIAANEQRVLDYAVHETFMDIPDGALQQSAEWSKMVLESNHHYLDGNLLPMPCPAEYNFFFTHDLLLTGLGAVHYDPDFLKDGFEFLLTLNQPDSILAHAYYWKDDRYVTEYANSDNWNHLWIIIAAASYLRHSNDLDMVSRLYPILYKSYELMRQNRGEHGLMYAKRPDWWDTGNRYGARAYITILMHKAMKDLAYINQRLKTGSSDVPVLLQAAEDMKRELTDRLWSAEQGFLLNMLDETEVDEHYYAGSLLAVYYDLLDAEKSKALLTTAREELLDPNIGLRNAMPPDFHELIDVYNFAGMESGEPYFYFNGGVWPHNNAWYAMALLQNGQVEEAAAVLKKYMSVDGILNSPNGQPSFFEYRITDPNSSRYGEIDKPTFLWAGGWYLNVLYQLAGCRSNAWNIFFTPQLPGSFQDCGYDVFLAGRKCRVTYSGRGEVFSRIARDGVQVNSAVVDGPADQLEFFLGYPTEPYLAEINAPVTSVSYTSGWLRISLAAWTGYPVTLEIVSPRNTRVSPVEPDSGYSISEQIINEIWKYQVIVQPGETHERIELRFE